VPLNEGPVGCAGQGGGGGGGRLQYRGPNLSQPVGSVEVVGGDETDVDDEDGAGPAAPAPTWTASLPPREPAHAAATNRSAAHHEVVRAPLIVRV
jgi:hypothetical protein